MGIPGGLSEHLGFCVDRSYFIAVDTDHSGSIDAKELQRALVNGDWSNFDEGTVKMMVTQFSTRRDGLITFGEFAALYAYVQQWSDAFRRADRDRSGTIDQGEMGLALRNFGFNLEPSTLRMVMNKYSTCGLWLRPARFIAACSHPYLKKEGMPQDDMRDRAEPGADGIARVCVCLDLVRWHGGPWRCDL